jgi:hypothetical protein
MNISPGMRFLVLLAFVAAMSTPIVLHSVAEPTATPLNGLALAGA